MTDRTFHHEEYNWGCKTFPSRVKAMVVQPQFRRVPKKHSACLHTEQSEEYEVFIIESLQTAKTNDVNLLVFPEYSIPQEYHGLIQQWSAENSNCIVIAGTDFIDSHNRSATFYKGKAYFTDKLNPSSHEELIDHFRGGDTVYKFINTPIGSFSILICDDLACSSLMNCFDKNNMGLDFLVVVACEDISGDHCTKLERLVEGAHNEAAPLYCLYSTCGVHNGRERRSAVFASEHKEAIERAVAYKHIAKNTSSKVRYVHDPKKSRHFIAEFNLENKRVHDLDTSPGKQKVSILFPQPQVGGITIPINAKKADAGRNGRRGLFVGAHPDDIEIGTGGMVQKFLSAGYDVYALVLTSIWRETERELEARNGLRHLGIKDNNIVFSPFSDDVLKDRKSSLHSANAAKILKSVLDENGITITPDDIVVVHSRSDTHKDHIAANQLLHKLFADSVFMHFRIYKSITEGAFNPSFYTIVTNKRLEQKNKAVCEHKTQMSKKSTPVKLEAIESYERSAAQKCELKDSRIEALEIVHKSGRQTSIVPRDLLIQSEHPFQRLWNNILGEKTQILMLTKSNAYKRTRHTPFADDEQEGVNTLKKHFDDYFPPRHDIIRCKAAASDSKEYSTAALQPNNHIVVLIGGSKSNTIVDSEYNRDAQVNWIVDFDRELGSIGSAGTSAKLRKRRTNIEYTPSESTDYGVISFIAARNNVRIVHVAGCTGKATKKGLEILSAPQDYEFLDAFEFGQSHKEFPFVLDYVTNSIKLIED